MVFMQSCIRASLRRRRFELSQFAGLPEIAEENFRYFHYDSDVPRKRTADFRYLMM